jgi:NTP pyrophosphatase (non-canonical NTP hydrolase)
MSLIREEEKLLKLSKEAVDAWGIEAQLRMLQEECGECVAAVNRYFRARDNSRVEMISEIADVLIMAIQGLRIFGPAVEEEIHRKLCRLDERLEKRRQQLKKISNDSFFDVDGIDDGG